MQATAAPQLAKIQNWTVTKDETLALNMRNSVVKVLGWILREQVGGKLMINIYSEGAIENLRKQRQWKNNCQPKDKTHGKKTKNWYCKQSKWKQIHTNIAVQGSNRDTKKRIAFLNSVCTKCLRIKISEDYMIRASVWYEPDTSATV